MAKYSLRQYNREVEGLIENGQIEEAIAHCKYILHSYPKYIDTYRLLGKTYLEIERYADAADIFQRVLACVPDDLVSQIGMSMIREAEKDLDGAIWHMERAYDIQPANSAVQEELRRLYGIRDGEAPAKIRLSRGALVRMYARGKLFQQAISEIHAALKEEPQRYDLRVQLARMYWLTGSKIKAAEECTSLLGEYPFCLEANRILAEILPETSRATDTQVYQERVYALDPYAQFISVTSPQTSDVPDQAVMIDRLEWYPGMQESVYLTRHAEPATTSLPETNPITEAPAWLLPELETTAEVKPFEDTTEQPEQPENLALFEDQLNTAQAAPVQAFPDLFPETPSPDLNDALIPDWMKGAGWTVGSGEGDEAESNEIEQSVEENEGESGEIFAAEIPEWIRSLAPKAGSQKPVAPAPVETPAPEQPVAQHTELNSEEILQDIPDWLNPMLSSEVELPSSPDIDIQLPEDQAAVSEEKMDFSSLVQAADEPTPVNTPSTENATVVVQDETTNWLENLAAIYGSDKETLIARPEDRVIQPPVWVRDETPETPAGNLPENSWVPEPMPENYPVQPEKSPSSASSNAEEEEQIPDWLLKMRGSDVIEPAAPKGEPETSTVPEPVDSLANGFVPPAPEISTPTADAENDAFPSWGVDENAESQPTSLYPKHDDWKLEFDASVNASAPDDSKTEPPFIPTGINESDVEKMVENALPDWMTEIQPEPEAPVAAEGLQLTTEEPAPVEVSPTPASAPVDEFQAAIDQAREHLMAGAIAPAVDAYNQLIDSGQHIDLSIEDLQQALYRYPVEPALWETLGNALAKNNQLQDALDAYTKAEELIR